jgi:hypothetical protein
MFNLKGIGCEDVEWIKLAQHRVQWWASLNTVWSIYCWIFSFQ